MQLVLIVPFCLIYIPLETYILKTIQNYLLQTTPESVSDTSETLSALSVSPRSLVVPHTLMTSSLLLFASGAVSTELKPVCDMFWWWFIEFWMLLLSLLHGSCRANAQLKHIECEHGNRTGLMKKFLQYQHFSSSSISMWTYDCVHVQIMNLISEDNYSEICLYL